MAFKKLSTSSQFRKWSLWEEGESMVFKLKGFTHGEYKAKPTTNFLAEILEEVEFDDYKDNPIEVGKILSLSLPTMLQDHLNEDAVGSTFRLEYDGKKWNKTKTDQYHTFILEVDEDDVAGAPVDVPTVESRRRKVDL